MTFVKNFCLYWLSFSCKALVILKIISCNKLELFRTTTVLLIYNFSVECHSAIWPHDVLSWRHFFDSFLCLKIKQRGGGHSFSSWGISILFFDLPVTFLSHSFFSTWGNLPSHFPLLHVSIFEPIFENFAAFWFDDDSANFDMKTLCFNILFLILCLIFSFVLIRCLSLFRILSISLHSLILSFFL
jgi:hypothetical protein